MKSYTDLEQSKKLAEILPLESADGFLEYHDKWCSEGDEWEGYEDYPRAEPYLEYTRKENEWKEDKSDVPCWSLAALLGVLPNKIVSHETAFEGEDTEGINDIYYKRIESTEDGLYTCYYSGNGCIYECVADNPVDACVAMIEKLHELNLL